MPTVGKFSSFGAAGALLALALGCTGQVAGGGSSGGNVGPGGQPGGNGGPGPGAPGGGAPGPGGGGANPGGGGPAPGGGGGGGPAPGAMNQPGRGVFYRLNRLEYNNTIRDLLGDRSAPASAFSPDPESGHSGYHSGGVVANADAVRLFDATEAIAASAARRLPEILPCKMIPAPAGELACAQQFIVQFGKRAFRRPLLDEEIKSFNDFYAQQRAAGQDFANAIRVVLSAFLLSPQFLYRWEVTPKTAVKEGAFVRYNSWEVASRLSYLLWASMPDDAGFALAEQNKLATPDQIEAEARRMLKDPRARDMVADFFLQWLAVTDINAAPKDPKVFKDYSPELARAMVAETAAFATSVVLDGDGKLGTLFTSTSSFVDANLARLYKVANVTSPTPVPANLNASERAGILTHASWLTAHANSEETNPPRRGKVMADRVICVELGLPPDDVPDPKPPSPNLSVRERFEEHSAQACAIACHQVLDPLGFAFENYNGIGAFQTTDGGKPVNASGRLTLDGQPRPFKNAVELAGILGQSKQVASCMTRQFVRYALRRRETPGDEASMAAAEAAFGRNAYNLRELMVALTRTAIFTHRTPSPGEVLR